jgi:CheY-like chemotaxis protein
MRSLIERILLVDDSEADNVFHEIVLRRAGFGGEITVCESGQAALDFLNADPGNLPDLLLLDINIPGMSGFAFLELAAPLLRPQRSATVVMLSSSSLPADRARAEALAEVAGYITKPLTIDVARALLAGEF